MATTQTVRAVPVQANNEKFTNLVTTANVEGSHALQDNLVQIIFRTRNSAKIQFTFTNGETNTKYFTVEGSTVCVLDGIRFSDKVLYVRTDIDSVVEIIELY